METSFHRDTNYLASNVKVAIGSADKKCYFALESNEG